MTKRLLQDIRRPVPKFRLDLLDPEFETKVAAQKEDDHRIKSLMRLAKTHSKRSAKALALADRLRSDAPTTIVSKRHMRPLRINVIGDVLRCIEEAEPTTVRFFTLAGRGLRLTPRQLMSADARLFPNALKTDIFRVGSSEATGWLIAFLHGEFNPTTKSYQLHFHGVAADDMIDVVDALRHRRKYRSGGGVRFRVQIKRKPPTTLPHLLTYLLQSFWDSKPMRGKTQKFSGPGRKRRIPEPYHAQHLLWLDRWTVDDLCIRINIGIKNNKLCVK
jgi:hypothetical protein